MPSGQRRRPAAATPQLRQQQQAEQQQLRASHVGDIAQWRATTASLNAALGSRARGDVAGRYAHQWAILMANRDAPDFLAKVAVLRAEEAGAVGVRIAELSPLLHAQRTASRRLLSDRHRRQRQAVRSKWQTLMAPSELGPADAADRWETGIKTAWRRVLFHAAANRLTRGPGIRLVYRRKPVPPGVTPVQ
jgi:hypothetical protein